MILPTQGIRNRHKWHFAFALPESPVLLLLHSSYRKEDPVPGTEDEQRDTAVVCGGWNKAAYASCPALAQEVWQGRSQGPAGVVARAGRVPSCGFSTPPALLPWVYCSSWRD